MRRFLRHLLLAIGWLSLGLGIVGTVMPILPTAPFVLLAAACFLRSSQRLHGWLVSHPALGCHVEDYLAGRGLPGRTKFVALASLWVSVLASAILFVERPMLDVLLVATALGVSAYLLRLPTCTARTGAP